MDLKAWIAENLLGLDMSIGFERIACIHFQRDILKKLYSDFKVSIWLYLDNHIFLENLKEYIKDGSTVDDIILARIATITVVEQFYKELSDSSSATCKK